MCSDGVLVNENIESPICGLDVLGGRIDTRLVRHVHA